MATVKMAFSLSKETASRLLRHKNRSAVVEEALRGHFAKADERKLEKAYRRYFGNKGGGK